MQPINTPTILLLACSLLAGCNSESITLSLQNPAISTDAPATDGGSATDQSQTTQDSSDQDNSSDQVTKTPVDNDNDQTTATGDASVNQPPSEDSADAENNNPETETDPVVPDARFNGDWTQLQLPAFGPYGTHSFAVPAAQNWVNTGLYLRAGETASINAEGLWHVKSGSDYDANGNASKQARGCNEGQLVARIGLYYKDDAITCIGTEGSITAHEDGIVYVGAVVSNDLGETYEARKNAAGELQVTITSQGDTVPSLAHDQAASYDFSAVRSGWVEVVSQHNILTLPIATAIKDADKLEAAGDRLDAIYLQHAALRGKRPYHGQPIRWFADTKDAPGWMLAGNPIRMDPALVDANNNSRITLAAEAGNNDWGFAHELGHTFNFAGGDWYYTTFGGLESWPNIFTLNAIEQLQLPPRELDDCVQRKSDYLAKNEHQDSLGDAWTGLCFLMEFQQAYGWNFYQRFYQQFNENPGHGWQFLHQRFSEAAGEDVGPIFDSWNIVY